MPTASPSMRRPSVCEMCIRDRYKDIKLNATLVSGGGATSEDAEVTIEPSTLRVTGNTAVLDAMADELTIRTIDLAQITGTETFEVTPELPSGVTSRADSQTVKITVTLKGLVTKEFTVPTASILRKEAPAGMTFADQNVKITVRGRASVMSTLRMELSLIHIWQVRWSPPRCSSWQMRWAAAAVPASMLSGIRSAKMCIRDSPHPV